MLNLIKADAYRILFKKNFYIYFISLFVLYCLILLFQSNSLTEAGIISQANSIFTFLTLIGGGYLFATIYNDDLNAKSLPALIGFGKKRITIIISKLILTIIISSIVFLLGYVTLYLSFMALGLNIDQSTNIALIKIMFTNLLKLWAFCNIVSILVYGTQKATTSIVIFVLLAANIISQLLFVLFSQFKGTIDLTVYLISPIVNELVNNVSIQTITPYIIYNALFIALAYVMFRKKDLEF